MPVGYPLTHRKGMGGGQGGGHHKIRPPVSETGVGLRNLAGCATTDCGFPPDCPQEGKKDRTGAENREKNLLTGGEVLGYNGYSQGK